MTQNSSFCSRKQASFVSQYKIVKIGKGWNNVYIADGEHCNYHVKLDQYRTRLYIRQPGSDVCDFNISGADLLDKYTDVDLLCLCYYENLKKFFVLRKTIINAVKNGNLALKVNNHNKGNFINIPIDWLYKNSIRIISAA